MCMMGQSHYSDTPHYSAICLKDLGTIYTNDEIPARLLVPSSLLSLRSWLKWKVCNFAVHSAVNVRNHQKRIDFSRTLFRIKKAHEGDHWCSENAGHLSLTLRVSDWANGVALGSIQRQSEEVAEKKNGNNSTSKQPLNKNIQKNASIFLFNVLFWNIKSSSYGVLSRWLVGW